MSFRRKFFLSVCIYENMLEWMAPPLQAGSLLLLASIAPGLCYVKFYLPAWAIQDINVSIIVVIKLCNDFIRKVSSTK